MAIRSGIGIGGAQVIDTRDIMSASARQIAQQQKAQALQAEREAKSSEKYNEELADNDVELVDIIRYARFWLKIKNPNGYEEIEESNIIDDEENTVNYIIENDENVENVDDEENNYDDYNGAAEYKVPGNW